MDLFFYREPEEAEKEEQAAKEQVVPVIKAEVISHEPVDTEWSTKEPTETWAEEPAVVPPPTGGVATPAAAATAVSFNKDWATEVQNEQDWAATKTSTNNSSSTNWGGSDWR